MAIKEIPITVRQYYKSMQANIDKQRENERVKLAILDSEIFKYRQKLKSKVQHYKDKFNIDLTKYEEFVSDKYIDGSFYRAAKGMFVNHKDDYELVGDLYDIYEYAKCQKDYYETRQLIEHYDKCIGLTFKEYNSIIKAFYAEVHKRMITEGVGYVFEGSLGWICINRVMLKRAKRKLDWAATKRREKEILAAGKRFYNKEEAEWCSRNGIPYQYEDKRVYLNNECYYEIAYLHAPMPNGIKLSFAASDYRGREVRGKTNDDILKEYKGDVNVICGLPLDLKTKLSICVKADSLLYTKFIRNENQKSVAYIKANS